MSTSGRALIVGDEATTDFHSGTAKGRIVERVRIIARETGQSQRGVIFRVCDAKTGREWPSYYDADWFEPVQKQEQSK